MQRTPAHEGSRLSYPHCSVALVIKHHWHPMKMRQDEVLRPPHDDAHRKGQKKNGSMIRTAFPVMIGSVLRGGHAHGGRMSIPIDPSGEAPTQHTIQAFLPSPLQSGQGIDTGIMSTARQGSTRRNYGLFPALWTNLSKILEASAPTSFGLETIYTVAPLIHDVNTCFVKFFNIIICFKTKLSQ